MTDDDIEIIDMLEKKYSEEFVKALETEVRRADFEFADLMNDFEFVKDLNRELSLRYQDFVNSIPKPSEIDVIIRAIEKGQQGGTAESQAKRIFQLKRFRTAAVLLEQQDEKGTPPKYEEIFK
jgi:hypothetical protein